MHASTVAFPDFAVACGEEASDPTVFHAGSVVRVDELTASAHWQHQDADLEAVGALGVRTWRYGMPWRLVEPEAGIYDWTLWDRALTEVGLFDATRMARPVAAAMARLAESRMYF